MSLRGWGGGTKLETGRGGAERNGRLRNRGIEKV